MAERAERPVFSEGQVLSAQELNTAFDLGHARVARHARQQHRWGIVEGLKLVGAQGPVGFEVTLQAGVAIDARGREIVVPRDEFLQPSAFNVFGKENDWFPVFLVGVDEPLQAGALAGEYGGGAGRRVLESYELQFGRPQEVDTWEQDQEALAVGGELEPLTPEEAPRVLLGFVRWSAERQTFAEVSERSPTGATRRYAGVRGNTIESHDKGVLVRLGQGEEPVLSVHAGQGGLPLLQLDREGNLSLQGGLQGALERGVKVSSGIASNGVKLPLPDGVDEQFAGTQAVHVFIKPLVRHQMLIPMECRVDEQRRVRCVVRELTVGSDSPAAVVLEPPRPWAVEYLVVVGPKRKP